MSRLIFKFQTGGLETWMGNIPQTSVSFLYLFISFIRPAYSGVCNSQSRQLRIVFPLRMSEVHNGEQEGHNYLYSEIFYGVQKLNKYFCPLRVIGTSLLTHSYIGEQGNGRNFKCGDKRFIVWILILRRVLS